jgi:hypothetical protein
VSGSHELLTGYTEIFVIFFRLNPRQVVLAAADESVLRYAYRGTLHSAFSPRESGLNFKPCAMFVLAKLSTSRESGDYGGSNGCCITYSQSSVILYELASEITNDGFLRGRP